LAVKVVKKEIGVILLEKKAHWGATARRTKEERGRNLGKRGRGVFKPSERVCALNELGGQLGEKNAKFETFAFTFLLKVPKLHR